MFRYSSRLCAAALAAVVAVPAVAFAQSDYPSRPIELVVPTPPGGGTDISMRLLSEIASESLGQEIVVVNRPGGGGGLGMQTIVNAKPDGYTIGGLWNAPLTMTPHMLPVAYGPDDYQTVSLATWAPTTLCVKADFPADTGEELVEAIKKDPGKYTYGNDGVGGTLHLAVERISQALDIEARPVPFGGAGETLKAFLGDHIDIYGGSIAPILPYAKDGTAKCLIVTQAESSQALPDAASLSDLGIPDTATVLWRGVIAPDGLPDEVAGKLETAFSEAAKSDRFKEFMASRGEESRGTTAGGMRDQINSEYEAIGTIIARLGISQK